MLKNYTLLKSQKNRVYDLLRQGGLEPAEFSWNKEEIAGSLIVSRLNYREGTYYFQFSSHEVNAWCTACPGQFRNLDYEYPRSWEEQEGVFRKWVQFLKRELAASDPWGDLAKYRLALDGEPTEEVVNEAISVQEAVQIEQGLVRLEEALVRELALSEEQAALVGARMNYLAEAARRQKSRDWVYTALGVYASLGAALSVPETALKALWQLFQVEVGQFVHLTPAGTGRPGALPGRPIAPVSAAPAQPAQPQKKLGLFF
jgi:hypothetical protein